MKIGLFRSNDNVDSLQTAQNSQNDQKPVQEMSQKMSNYFNIVVGLDDSVVIQNVARVNQVKFEPNEATKNVDGNKETERFVLHIRVG